MPGFDPAAAAHLLRRAAFGADADGIRRAAGLGMQAAVDSLVDFDRVADLPDDLPAQALHSDKTTKGKDFAELQLWWVDRMVRSPRPLQELMTLFWHNHFATAEYKVGHPDYMKRQNDLFRRNALGNFRQLVGEVSRDPAMLIWLDAGANHKRSPNENYGRELMELFTLGIGNYTEDDVHAAAHAFTGWHLDYRTGRFVFARGDHDSGSKTFLGQTGNWNGDDVLDIIVHQPAHARFLTKKLWEFFAYPSPSPTDLQPVIDAYVGSGFEVKPAVRAILTSGAFYADQARWTLFRSPAELVVAALRGLGIRPTRAVLGAMARMGQELFNPPNVAGWKGGSAWINPGTLLARFNFAEGLAAQLPAAALKDDESALLASGDTSGVIQRWLGRFGLVSPSPATSQALAGYLQAGSWTRRTAEEKLRGLIQLVLAAPEFQLK